MEFSKYIDNECGFHIEKKGEFCSPPDVVEKLEILLDAHGGRLQEPLLQDNDEKQLKDRLKAKFNCETEACILEKPEVIEVIGNTDLIINEMFKPTGPRDNNNWFSNDDIDSVLDQIQKKYTDKHFLHHHYQMIDFEKVQSSLATTDWPQKYQEGYRTFGAVFNTDVSTGRGKHWFAIYGCFEDSAPDFTIEYFNSSGELPMDEVTIWMKKVKHLWQSSFDKKINDVVVTRIVNQKDNWNCGSYSLYYIISRLDGVPYQHFKHNLIGDERMQEFRKFLFRPSK